MKIIAAVGDSHTWGEGVGAEYLFKNAMCGGDKRMLEFFYPFYVNLLREKVNAKTGSSAVEYSGWKLLSLCESTDGDFGFVSGKAELTLREKFSFCRVFFRADTVTTEAEILIDGKSERKVKLNAEEQTNDRCISVVNMFIDDGEHTLTVRGVEGGRIGIHRIECYTGEYAVINCGIGSCPVPKYAENYYEHYVCELHPEIILFEGCTINDWLSGITPEEYGKALKNMLDMMHEDTTNIIMHTVFPIGGNVRKKGSSFVYDDYINEVRRVAFAENIPLADCNSEITKLLETVPAEQREEFLYHDDWHPNATGHSLYARQIFSVLEMMMC